MPRPSRYPPLPPITPSPLNLISSPPWIRPTLRTPVRPRYPLPYVALTREPRALSLVLKLATAPRELGPLRLRPSNPHLHPAPKSRTLTRCPPPSFEIGCPCPLSRRCGNWRPGPPMPKFFSPPWRLPADITAPLPRERLARALKTPPPTPVHLLTLPSRESHVLRRRKTRLYP